MDVIQVQNALGTWIFATFSLPTASMLVTLKSNSVLPWKWLQTSSWNCCKASCSASSTTSSWVTRWMNNRVLDQRSVLGIKISNSNPLRFCPISESPIYVIQELRRIPMNVPMYLFPSPMYFKIYESYLRKKCPKTLILIQERVTRFLLPLSKSDNLLFSLFFVKVSSAYTWVNQEIQIASQLY